MTTPEQGFVIYPMAVTSFSRTGDGFFIPQIMSAEDETTTHLYQRQHGLGACVTHATASVDAALFCAFAARIMCSKCIGILHIVKEILRHEQRFMLLMLRAVQLLQPREPQKRKKPLQRP